VAIPPQFIITASKVLCHHSPHGFNSLYVSSIYIPNKGISRWFPRSDIPISAFGIRCLLWAC